MPLFNFLIAGDERSMIDFDKGGAYSLVLSIGKTAILPVLDHGTKQRNSRTCEKLHYGRLGPEKNK